MEEDYFPVALILELLGFVPQYFSKEPKDEMYTVCFLLYKLLDDIWIIFEKIKNQVQFCFVAIIWFEDLCVVKRIKRIQ